MKMIQQASKLILAFTLALILSLSNAVSVLAETNSLNQTFTLLAEANSNIGQQLKGNLQKSQGKIEETYGNITGDRDAQVAGKAKQAEGEIRVTQDAPEPEIEGKARQAENNIYRYQSRERKATNPQNALR